MYGVLLFMNICIQGKRSILFFALLVYILIMLPGLRNKALDSKERRRKMFGIVIIAVIAVGIMIASTLVVKVTSRGYDANDFSELYTALRIDFFRDDRVRMAIYAILNPNQMKIVDFPGQTLLPIPTWIFPIDHILGKFGISYPAYTSYFCSALLMLPRSQSFTYMTPCIYAELISNFGFFGALFMPFLCVWFASKADKYPYPFNVFILVSFIALQMAGETFDGLNYNQVLVLNLGFDMESVDKYVSWIYFPGDEFFYRIGFYNNIAGTERLSLYVEIGYKAGEEIDVEDALRKTLTDLHKIGITRRAC